LDPQCGEASEVVSEISVFVATALLCQLVPTTLCRTAPAGSRTSPQRGRALTISLSPPPPKSLSLTHTHTHRGVICLSLLRAYLPYLSRLLFSSGATPAFVHPLCRASTKKDKGAGAACCCREQSQCPAANARLCWCTVQGAVRGNGACGSASWRQQEWCRGQWSCAPRLKGTRCVVGARWYT
jgi:hypothetical protein